MQLCLYGHFCRENTLEAPHVFPKNISDRNAGWKGSVEVIVFSLSCSMSGSCPVQPHGETFAADRSRHRWFDLCFENCQG